MRFVGGTNGKTKGGIHVTCLPHLTNGTRQEARLRNGTSTLRDVTTTSGPCGTRLGLVGQIRPWGQEWVRTPLRAPHLPGVVTYNSGLLSYLNATIPVSIDALYGMLSKFACLLSSQQGSSRLVRSPPSPISPIFVTTSLILKSNTFFCPPFRPPPPGCAHSPPSASLTSPIFLANPSISQ